MIAKGVTWRVWTPNRGPGDEGRTARYLSMAVTRHKETPVTPKCSIVPAPKSVGFALLHHALLRGSVCPTSSTVSMAERRLCGMGR